MTKQEQIEEMGKVMPEKIKDPLDNSRYIIFGKSLRREIARIYYNAGYRKLPEDSVVLSREEYIDLSRNYVGEQVAQARKETAEKILDLLVPDCKACDENWHSGCLCLRATLAEKIAKQFGVEIKE